MASIPERGDWITFPLEQHEVIQLEWFDKKTTQTAKYYVDKCWFGRRKDNAQCGEGLIPIGKHHLPRCQQPLVNVAYQERPSSLLQRNTLRHECKERRIYSDTIWQIE
jgi:hypothetical protein